MGLGSGISGELPLPPQPFSDKKEIQNITFIEGKSLFFFIALLIAD
jgi:hypothetical protein